MGKDSFAVCVVGGAGAVGQHLCALLATEDLVADLRVYDHANARVPAEAVGLDVGHMGTDCRASGYSVDPNSRTVDPQAERALAGCDLVLMVAAVPRRPGMSQKDFVRANGNAARKVLEECSWYCPNAVVAFMTTPINSIVPAMCELWKKRGLPGSKIVGMTTIHSIRASKFVHEKTGRPCANIHVPVIGGNTGRTIVPIFSQDRTARSLDASILDEIRDDMRNAVEQVLNAKEGTAGPTMSLAYAAMRLSRAILSGLAGVPKEETAYVMSNAIRGLDYVSSRVVFGEKGVQAVSDPGKLSEVEEQSLEEMKTILQSEIEIGKQYAREAELGSAQTPGTPCRRNNQGWNNWTPPPRNSTNAPLASAGSESNSPPPPPVLTQTWAAAQAPA